jgi:hypothetical protein
VEKIADQAWAEKHLQDEYAEIREQMGINEKDKKVKVLASSAV